MRQRRASRPRAARPDRQNQARESLHFPPSWRDTFVGRGSGHSLAICCGCPPPGSVRGYQMRACSAVRGLNAEHRLVRDNKSERNGGTVAIYRGLVPPVNHGVP